MLLKRLIRRSLGVLPVRLRCFFESILTSGKLTIGQGSFVHKSVHVLGRNNVAVGSNTCVSERCWLNVNSRNAGQIAIKIGDNCFIGKNNFFSSGKSIVVNDYVLTATGCKFIGSSHQMEDPGVPYLMAGTSNIDAIEIGVNCFIGAGATVLGNVVIGHGSVVGTDSLVLRDIPPFSLAVGNPTKIVKRYSFRQKKWILASDLSIEEEEEMPTEADYLAHLKANFSRINIPWVAAGNDMGDI